MANNLCARNYKNGGNSYYGNGTSQDRNYATLGSQVNNPSYVGWTYTLNQQRPDNNITGTASNAKTQTEKWFSDNIGSNTIFTNKLAQGKFYNDRSTDKSNTTYNMSDVWSATGGMFAYAAKKRLWEIYAPTFGCLSTDVYNIWVRALIADEVIFAGGTEDENSSYYLYYGYFYWTMTPNHWNGSVAWSHCMTDGGGIGVVRVDYQSPGFRPVINLKASVTFSKGNGTTNNLFIVS